MCWRCFLVRYSCRWGVQCGSYCPCHYLQSPTVTHFGVSYSYNDNSDIIITVMEIYLTPPTLWLKALTCAKERPEASWDTETFSHLPDSCILHQCLTRSNQVKTRGIMRHANFLPSARFLHFTPLFSQVKPGINETNYCSRQSLNDCSEIPLWSRQTTKMMKLVSSLINCMQEKTNMSKDTSSPRNQFHLGASLPASLAVLWHSGVPPEFCPFGWQGHLWRGSWKPAKQRWQIVNVTR